MININSDKAHELLKKCQVLKEYSLFVQEVRKYAGDGDALKKAIHVCIDRGILKDYLKRKGSEVRNMLIAEYSYEKDIQVKQEEAMQIGRKQGIEQGMLLSGQIFRLIKESPDLTDSQVAKALGCRLEDVGSVRKMLGI